MVTKKLIMGTSIGYAWKDIRHWLNSAQRTGNEITALFADTDSEIIEACRESGACTREYSWEVSGLSVNVGKSLWSRFSRRLLGRGRYYAPHNFRFLFQYLFLKEVSQDFSYVVVTDTRDVVFLSDSFPKIEAILQRETKSLIVGSECVIFRDRPWGSSNNRDAFPFVHQELLGSGVVNVGVLCGHPKAVAELCLLLFCLAVHNPAYVSDQAFLNLLLHLELLRHNVYIADPNDSLIIHLAPLQRNQGGTLPPPRQQPEIVNGIPLSSTGEAFPIVHQYDRIEGMRESLGQHLGLEEAV